MRRTTASRSLVRFGSGGSVRQARVTAGNGSPPVVSTAGRYCRAHAGHRPGNCFPEAPGIERLVQFADHPGGFLQLADRRCRRGRQCLGFSLGQLPAAGVGTEDGREDRRAPGISAAHGWLSSWPDAMLWAIMEPMTVHASSIVNPAARIPV